ncbi:isochorismate synthase [Catenuloplanes nepalensis]|uniref:isochorismate synthase n=1 Tax=Catenuloplanes nepalensis TaxID=587533 RepID=A0ABT9MY39_9ACTN|nr:isochorismate synthase DhbC [Catenuloplanes nepalensis]MDP9796345.1 isochorismate synthase [Catenuloplanes nepalensis]
MTDLRTQAATELIDDYRPGSSFFFASPRHTLLAEGVAVGVPGRAADLPSYVSGMLGALREAGDEAPIAVGAIPFDGTAAAQLCVPMSVRRSAPPSGRVLAEPTGTGFHLRPVPEPARYTEGVTRALALMEGDALTKVVLARSLHVTADAPVDLRDLVRRLAHRDPRGYTFAADLPHGRTLVGASPELLVSRFGTRMVANPMAGSAARSADRYEDVRRAAALRDSEKDLREHAVVVESVVEALRPYCKEIEVPVRPSVVPTATMWHLASRIAAEVADDAISALALAHALHPTPAICGVPVDAARAAIAEIEPFDRGFYTGMVGWTDAAGDGEWVVTIRCAEVDDRSMRLYAGAGIVPGSSPEAELAETTAKFRTMLRAMGLGDE